jgi:adenylate cyclase class IV
MFEVEKKFKLSDDDVKTLTTGAEFLSEKTFTDVYFDTLEFALTKNDIWLRKRGDDFELKLPMHSDNNKLTQQYQEIEGAEKIREIFAIPVLNDFEYDIKAFAYQPFCECITTRKKFKKEEFIIDLDVVEYKLKDGSLVDFTYDLAEIEILVENKNEMSEAAEKIEKFAMKNGLKNDYVRGKVLEFLKRKKPEHFQALVDAGVVREEKFV